MCFSQYQASLAYDGKPIGGGDLGVRLDWSYPNWSKPDSLKFMLLYSGKLLRFCGDSRKFNPQILGVWHPLAQRKRAIRKSFLRENLIFHQSAKFFSLESFPLYGIFCIRFFQGWMLLSFLTGTGCWLAISLSWPSFCWWCCSHSSPPHFARTQQPSWCKTFISADWLYVAVPGRNQTWLHCIPCLHCTYEP